jgi:hypothetical protein
MEGRCTMNRLRKALFPLFVVFLMVFPGLGYGGTEEDIFTIKVEPDALIVLDLSGSMGSPPPGDYGYSNAKSGDYCSGDKVYGAPTGSYNKYCANDGYYYADSDACTGPFYASSGGRVNCQKKVIAQHAIYNLLDDDKSGNDKNYNRNKIDKQDELSLGVRLGYMKFDHCTNTFTITSQDSGYGSGCNVLRQGFQALNQGSNGYYRTIYDMVTADIGNNANRTPLAGALSEAKSYLDAHKATDPAKDCRKKFVLFITDGWDTLACGASYSDVNDTKGWSYKRRRATVAAAKALHDAGYKVFVIGFGGEMPVSLANTLNWAAYFGGTFNPDVDQVGNTGAISAMAVGTGAGTACGNESVCDSFNPNSVGYPGGTDALGNDMGTDCSYSPNPDCCTVAPNDPALQTLSGYAFLAADASTLNVALRRAMDYVKTARYSFTVASVSAARLSSGNYLYEASFIPYLGDDPFWRGHLKKYKIDDTGTVVKPALLDAGDVLLDRTAARNMYTYLGGSVTPFNTTYITPTLLGLSTNDTTGRDKVVGYFRAESATYTQEQWKLGDIFHSNPVTIDPPSIYFNDIRSWSAFDSFRSTNKTREWLVVLGANDGQLHAFSTGDLSEKWSFLPPNLLPKLQLVAHATEPAPITLEHQFFVDGPVTVADVWLGGGSGLSKNASDWKTLMVVGLGKGVRQNADDDDPEYLWSSSPSCDSGFQKKYNPPYQYYCGYWAFNVTNTAATTPEFKWRLNATSYRSDDPLYIDEPWSKMAVGRVKIGGNEKWVGFFGGGYNVNSAYTDDDDAAKGKRAKGFFVADLSNGNILWSYTKRDNSAMDYPVPASPKVVDLDNDGFVDTAYISDLGGNIWRFRFCSITDPNTCNTDNWTGSQLFSSAGIVRPSFTTPSVAIDAGSQLWVFWGTGNKLDPRSTTGVDRFFAVKEKDFTTTFTKDDLEKLTTQAYHGTMAGWYYEFPLSGEKMLFDSTVFGGMAIFTTYVPTTGSDPCTQGGDAYLYAMAMMPIRIDDVTYNAGAGLMSKPASTTSTDGGNKSKKIGAGIPTAPLVSQKPIGTSGSTDIFLTVSGGAGVDTVVNSMSDIAVPPPPPDPNTPCPAGTPPALCRLRMTPPQAQVIHWRDRRVQ